MSLCVCVCVCECEKRGTQGHILRPSCARKPPGPIDERATRERDERHTNSARAAHLIAETGVELKLFLDRRIDALLELLIRSSAHGGGIG